MTTSGLSVCQGRLIHKGCSLAVLPEILRKIKLNIQIKVIMKSFWLWFSHLVQIFFQNCWKGPVYPEYNYQTITSGLSLHHEHEPLQRNVWSVSIFWTLLNHTACGRHNKIKIQGTGIKAKVLVVSLSLQFSYHQSSQSCTLLTLSPWRDQSN